MSEYQYYEFLAVDRPLTSDEQHALRELSSRAEITSHSLAVSYSYGDFRGDRVELMATMFDLHVYVANWGTRTFMLGFPRGAVDVSQLQQYALESATSELCSVLVEERNGRVVVTLSVGDEDGGGGWLDEDEAAGWLTALMSLRAAVLDGDLRLMYIGWLAAATAHLDDGGEPHMRVEADADDDAYAEDDEDDDWERDEEAALDRREPPVPPGLTHLDAALTTLATFLEVDLGLIDAASEHSAPLGSQTVTKRDATAWLQALPSTEKDVLLLRVLNGDRTVQHELARQVRQSLMPSPGVTDQLAPRTVRELIQRGVIRRAERQAAESARLQQERAAYLDELAGRESATWSAVESELEQRSGSAYERAVNLLRDLGDLAARRGTSEAFAQRVAELRQRHGNRPAFLKRLDRLGFEGS